MLCQHVSGQGDLFQRTSIVENRGVSELARERRGAVSPKVCLPNPPVARVTSTRRAPGASDGAAGFVGARGKVEPSAERPPMGLVVRAPASQSAAPGVRRDAATMELCWWFLAERALGAVAPSARDLGSGTLGHVAPWDCWARP